MQQLALAVRGGFARGEDPAGCARVAAVVPAIHTLVCAISRVLAEGSGQIARVLPRLDRGQTRSLARLTGCAATWVTARVSTGPGIQTAPRAEERMRFLAVVALLVFSVGGCWFATEYVASALALGSPWTTLGHERLYAPWQWIVWGRLFASRAPLVFRNAGAITSIAALAGAAASAMAALRGKAFGQ